MFIFPLLFFAALSFSWMPMSASLKTPPQTVWAIRAAAFLSRYALFCPPDDERPEELDHPFLCSLRNPFVTPKSTHFIILSGSFAGSVAPLPARAAITKRGLSPGIWPGTSRSRERLHMPYLLLSSWCPCSISGHSPPHQHSLAAVEIPRSPNLEILAVSCLWQPQREVVLTLRRPHQSLSSSSVFCCCLFSFFSSVASSLTSPFFPPSLVTVPTFSKGVALFPFFSRSVNIVAFFFFGFP